MIIHSYRTYTSSCTAPEASDAGDWSTLPGRVALGALLAFSLLALGTIAVPGHAHAAGSSARIIFTAPMYVGQNNGYAEGPVGTIVSVQGSGWAADNGNNPVTISLADEQNDTPGQEGSACQNGGTTIHLAGRASIPVDGSGTFTARFPWPQGITGHDYWVCGTQGATKSSGVDTFLVLASSAPGLSVTGGNTTPGGIITIVGGGWLPGGVRVVVAIATCTSCEPRYASSAEVTSSGNGSFSVSGQVPVSAPVGTVLYVTATNIDPDRPANDGALTVQGKFAAQFTVSSDAHATVTPTVTPTPTIRATATVPATGGATSDNHGNSSSDHTVLLVLLGALVVVLLTGAVIAVVRSGLLATTHGLRK